MAEQKRKISYGIDFEVNDAELKKLKKQLEQFKKLSIVNYANQQGVSLNNPATAEKQAHQLTKLKKDAAEFQRLMRLAYNPKTNSYNITKFNTALKQSGLNVKLFRAEMQKTVEGRAVWAAHINELTKFNTEIKQSHKLLDSLGKTLANTIKWTISSSLMQGVTRSISQAYGFAKNLDNALNDIRIVTGKSADEMARFAERANAVASNLGKGTNDYTRAALIYAQQGLGQKEIEEKTAITLKTANVTGQSAEEVSEELTAVWNGYKASAAQAELYVDRLAAVASTTASNLQELSIGMSKVASAAATLGVGEDQLAAQLSTIISVTRQAPETVGTALRTVYARITDIQAGLDEDGVTLGKYSGDMEKIGISVLDLNGNLRNMGEVMEEIGNKWSTMTQEQKIYLAQTMAGQRQYSNLMALFDNFDKYKSALNTAQNAEGKLQEQQDVYMDRLSTHVQQLTTATEHMWMGLTDTDGFKDIIDNITTIVEKVDKLFQSIGGGKNLLQSLVPIVMSLTSKTVASGINTMIMNSQLEKRQLRDQKSSQVLAQNEMEALQREGQQGSQRYQVLKQKSEFLQAAPGTFSTQQMDEINKRWSGSLEAADVADKARAELNQYSDIIQSITTVLGDNPIELKKVSSIEDLENIIIDISGQYNELSKKIERYAQDQDEINKQQGAAQQQLIDAYLQVATKVRKYESTQAQIVSQKQQELDFLSGYFSGLPITKNNKIKESPLRGIFNVMQDKRVTKPQIQFFENAEGFEEVSEIGDKKEKIKKIKEILENSIYKEIFDQIPPDKIKVEKFIEEVQKKFAEIEQLKANAQNAIQQAVNKQKAANQELLQRQQTQALKDNLQIQNIDKFQNNLKFLSQDFSSMVIPPELKQQLKSTKKEYQELSQAITNYNQKIQSSSKLSQEQIDVLRQEKEALEKKLQALLDTVQGTVDNINENVQGKGQKTIDEQKNSMSIGNNNKGAIKDIEKDANRQKLLQDIMSLFAGVNMLTAAFSNLGNAIEGAFYEGNWEGFIGAILTSAPMLILSLAQIKSGLLDMTKTASISAAVQKILSFDIGKTAKATWGKITATLADIKATKAKTAANVEGTVSEKGLAEAIGLTTSASVVAATAVLGVVAALAALKIAFYIANEARRKEIEYNQKIIEQEKEKQQQYNKEKDIISEVEELNKKYEQGIITRTELKNQVEELQKKYGDQSVRIQKLIKDYKNLGQAIEQVKRERNQDEAISVQRERAAAQVNAQRTMEIMHKADHFKLFGQTIPLPPGALAHITGKISGQPTVQIKTNAKGQLLGDQKAAASRLSSIMGEEGNIAKGWFGAGGYLNTFVMADASDYRSTKRQYDMLQQYINTASEEEKKTDFYKDIVDIVDSEKSSIEQAQEAQIKQIANSAEFAIINSKSDFSKVNSTSDYLQQYNQLKAEIEYEIYKKNPVATPQEINQQINQALTKAIPEKLQNMYGSKQQAIERLTSNLGQPANDIKQMIDSLDSAQLDAFLHMDLENVKSYEAIYEALKKTAQLDFSNVEGLTQANLNAAIDKYTKVQQILEAIQQGKKISGKTLQESLTDQQIKENFEADVRGQYSIKAGKTLAEVVNNLSAISVENYQTIYGNQLREIEKNKFYIDNKNNNREYQYQESTQDKEKIKEKAQKDINDNLITEEAYLKIGSFKYAGSQKTDIDFTRSLRDERRENLKNFLADQITSNQGNIKEETALKLYKAAQDEDWETVDNIIDKLEVDDKGLLAQQISKSRNYQNTKIKNIEDKDTEKNSKNTQSMINFLLNFRDNDEITKNIAKLQQYKINAQKNKTTKQEFQEVLQLVKIVNNEYKNADENLKNLQEQSQKILQQIHDGLFPIDKDVDETLVVKLGQQFQLTAKKSKLLDNALESNARKAKDVAEEVQRYNAALSSVIKNYATWQDKLSGSTADKLSVAPQIKNAMADTLGISENTLSDTFATTIQNLEDMRLALEGDEKAYKRLQQAAYNDILLHIGLDDTDLNEVRILLEDYFKDLDLDVAVGAELDQAALEKVLAELIKKGIDTEQQLEAIFAAKGVDLDVVVENGKAEILSYTKAATHELKQQEKSQEELKDLERERIKNQKELTKFLKDERDIYHQINRLLSDQERTIKRITRNQQDMYGTELLDNLNAESAEYEKQQKLLKSKQKLQQQDLANKKAELASKGASFDANGNISNYNNLIGSAINNVNSIISRERGVQEALSGGNTSDEIYKDLDVQLSSIGREKSQANDYLNDLKTNLSNYEKVKDQAEDVADQLTELSEKQIEINLKKFNMKLEVTLDLSQAEKTWNDYKRNVLQHDDIFNPNRALSAQKDNVQRLADINADSRSLDVVNQQIEKAMADNGALYKTQGQKKKAIEELQKKAIQLRKGILENEDAIKQTYLEQYDIISEIFEKQKSQYDFVNNQLEHNKNMMSLIYGENDYAVQNVYNDKMIENSLKSIESMNNRVQIAEENLRKARESGDTAVIEKAEAEWQTAIQNRNYLEEQSAQLMKDRYIAAINQIAHQMEQKLTNNKGFNYMDTEWDLMKKQSNLYLDDINSAFAVKNTEYLYNQVLNDTKGLKSQQQLKKVMSEQLDILKEKDKLTQYDVDRAQKVLEVEKARIALEQARNNKTQMRLKRDSQGNYSYQYVADQDNIAKAENDLQKAENDLYNFDKDNYENKLKEAYDATKEYQEKITALEIEYATATEERRKQIDEEKRLLDQQYSEYILNLSQETEWGKQNLMQSTMMNFSDMMNQEQIDFENMSDAQKEKWLGDMVPSINSGIAEMIGKFSTNPDSFKQIVVEATQAMDNERKTYQEGLAELQTAAGQNWNKIKQAMDPVVELQNELIIDNDRLKEQAGEIVEAMKGTLTALDTQEKKWEKVYEQTDNAVRRVYDYIAAIDKVALKAVGQNKKSRNIKETETQTVPTVNKLKTYRNTAPEGNNLKDKTGTPLKEESGKNLNKKQVSVNTNVLIKGLKELRKYGGWNWEEILPAKNKSILTRDFYGKLRARLTNMELPADDKIFGQAINLIYNSSLKHTNTMQITNQLRKNPTAELSRMNFNTSKYLTLLHEALGGKEFLTELDNLRLKVFDTGGYTGDWSSTQGKLAVLHQKELVLNKQDTANMLEMIQMVREMQQNELKMRMTQLNNEIQDIVKQNAQIEKIQSKDELQQSVEMNVNFPNVNSKKEIEQALTELVNLAAQRALKYKK